MVSKDADAPKEILEHLLTRTAIEHPACTFVAAVLVRTHSRLSLGASASLPIMSIRMTMLGALRIST
jgi:hypothetical protein